MTKLGQPLPPNITKIRESLGKETLVIKTKNSTVPSDFVRTEYLEYDNTFKHKIKKFIKRFFEQAEHYIIMAEQLLRY